MNIRRPPKWNDAFPEEAWYARVDTDWTTPATGTRCRFGSSRYGFCGKPPAATMFRGTTRQSYSYCADHMFNRWVEDGLVWSWCVSGTYRGVLAR